MFAKTKIPESGTVNPLLLFQMLRSAEDSETVAPAPETAIELGSPPSHTTTPGPQSPPAGSER